MSKIKFFKYFTIASLFLGLASCQDDTTADVNEQVNEQGQTKMIVKFSLPVSTSQENGHHYQYTGYTVVVTGEELSETYTDVDLSQDQITFNAVGDVTVSVYHPDFNAEDLDTVAYFGTTDQVLHTGTQSQVELKLDLVQGFVLVIAEQGAENQINTITINGDDSVEIDTYYYTATPQVSISVATDRGTMQSTDDLTIGKGLEYTVNAYETTLTVSFPEFENADQIELEMSEAVITEDNISKYDSYTVLADGSVEVVTGDKATNIFIPSSNLNEGVSLAQYNLSGLQASWENNTGATGVHQTGYTNIYLTNKGQNFRATLHSNGYIDIYNTSENNTYLGQYGDLNAASNPTAMSEFLADYGSYVVRANYYDGGTTYGNFIWRAGEGRGTILVQDYFVTAQDAVAPVVTDANILGATINSTNSDNGTVSASTNDTDASVWILRSDLTIGATLASYDLSNLKVSWNNGTASNESTGYINIYLKDTEGNNVRIDMYADGTFGFPGVNNMTYEEMISKYGNYIVRTDWIENKGLDTVNGNFAWRTGSERGDFTVYSYNL